MPLSAGMPTHFLHCNAVVLAIYDYCYTHNCYAFFCFAAPQIPTSGSGTCVPLRRFLSRSLGWLLNTRYYCGHQKPGSDARVKSSSVNAFSGIFAFGSSLLMCLSYAGNSYHDTEAQVLGKVCKVCPLSERPLSKRLRVVFR